MTKRKLNFKTFLEGMMWVLLTFVCTVLVGVGFLLEPNITSDGKLIAWFYIIVGIVVTGVVLYAIIDTSLEEKN